MKSAENIICSESDRAALFARKVRAARSTEIYFPLDDVPPSTKSKYEPDASFWHDSAQYPGVIIEVAYAQKRKRLGRLAEDYLLDSDASVQVIVGLDIEYGKKGSRKATPRSKPGNRKEHNGHRYRLHKYTRGRGREIE